MCLAGETKTGGIKREQSSNTTACTAYFEEETVSNPKLYEEACWALKTAKAQGMIDAEKDTSVLFHSMNTHKSFLDHLSKDTEFSLHQNSNHAIAIKTNPHLGVLKQLVQWGFGLEAASMEEVKLAVNAGCPTSKIVFDSPVKTRREIAICHEKLPGMLLNVNCIEELERIPENPNFVLGLRINPLVDTKTEKIFHVSNNESKFGTPIIEKNEILEAIRKYPITALHVHSGTAMVDLDSAVSAIKSVVNVAKDLNKFLAAQGLDRRITTIDIGGGVRPEILDSSKESRMQNYAAALKRNVPDLWTDFKMVTEFGQWSYFYSGFAASQVEYALQRGETRIAYLHLGADFLMRDVYNRKPRGIDFIPAGEARNRHLVCTDIAGPLCFAGDYLDKQVMLPKLEEGDEVLLLNTGSNAYGLWSRHCSRSIPQMIGVDMQNESLNRLSERFNPFVDDMW